MAMSQTSMAMMKKILVIEPKRDIFLECLEAEGFTPFVRKMVVRASNEHSNSCLIW